MAITTDVDIEGELGVVVPMYSKDYLLNGSSPDMSVNGSGTAQVFTYTPPTGEVRYLEEIDLFLFDSGTNDVTDFGAIGGGITNGLLIEGQTQGNAFTLSNSTDNVDLITNFSTNITIPPTNSGFLDTSDPFLGSFQPRKFIVLNESQGDFIRATVRDNLSSIDVLRIAVITFKDVAS